MSVIYLRVLEERLQVKQARAAAYPTLRMREKPSGKEIHQISCNEVVEIKEHSKQ